MFHRCRQQLIGATFANPMAAFYGLAGDEEVIVPERGLSAPSIRDKESAFCDSPVYAGNIGSKRRGSGAK
jgi:hypothetical protein